MIRRAFIAGTGLALLAPFSGCLTDSKDDSNQNKTELNNNSDEKLAYDGKKPQNNSNCFEVISLILVNVQDYVNWEETDVPVVDSADKRVSDLSILQKLLAKATESEEIIDYEYQKEWFSAVKKADKSSRISESDELKNTIHELPSDEISNIPPGPYISHEGYHFSMIVETEEPCPE